MSNILKDYKALRDELDAFYASSQDSNHDHLQLLESKGIPQGLKNTLVLIHSNYKSELREQKSFTYRFIRKVLDVQYDLAVKVEHNIKKTEESAKKTNIAYKTIKLTGIIVGTLLFGGFALAYINPEAFNAASSFIRDIITSVANIGNSTSE